jgi:hypothetical protein
MNLMVTWIDNMQQIKNRPGRNHTTISVLAFFGAGIDGDRLYPFGRAKFASEE